MRAFFVGLALLGFLSTAAYTFWREDLRYSQPTPAPADYVPVNTGDRPALNVATPGDRPTLLHFFSPDCPCSRFNLDHFESLLRRYRERVHVVAVLPKGYDGRAAGYAADWRIPVRVDTDGALAKACGVYSTPQAVLLDDQSAIFYRGNYNRSRYCTQPRTAYVQNALHLMLDDKEATPAEVSEALGRPYGCAFNGPEANFFDYVLNYLTKP
ncbi:MAG: hypothetical protein WBA12_02030 [Catalinimonas sp.]